MILVIPCIINNASYVKRIKHESYFSWQAQYLVKLEDDSYYFAYCNDILYIIRINYEIHISWQVQYLVKLEVDS